jgi:hypothetical protein
VSTEAAVPNRRFIVIEKVVDVELVNRTRRPGFSTMFDVLAVMNQLYQQTKALSQ